MMKDDHPSMKIILLHKHARLPRRAHPTDAGADLYTPGNFSGTIEPRDRLVVPLGIALLLPEGCAGFIHPRSGLAANSGVTVLNSPGTIDYGYTGEIQVVLYNTTARPFEVHPLMRVAQLVIQEVKLPPLDTEIVVVEPEEIPVTERGDRGLGSTGVLT